MADTPQNPRQITSPSARPALLSLDEVLARMLAVARDRVISEVEKVDTFDALGRVLARGVVSGLDVPPADNSAMDCTLPIRELLLEVLRGRRNSPT